MNTPPKKVLSVWERVALLTRLGNKNVLDTKTDEPPKLPKEDALILVHVVMVSEFDIPAIIINIPAEDFNRREFLKVLMLITNNLHVKTKTMLTHKSLRVHVPIYFEDLTEPQLIEKANEYATLASYWFEMNSQVVIREPDYGS